jgi:hypothetical protein
VPADIVTTLGSSSSVTLSPGQNAYLSFTAAAGQTATVTPDAGGAISLIRVDLVKSDKKTSFGGTEYWDPSGGLPVASAVPGPGTTTYYLRFDPVGGASGASMTFGLALS